MLFIGYKSVVPLPDEGLRFALYFFAGYSALGAAVLVFLKVTGKDAWLTRVGEAADSADNADNAGG
jgi:hypothetical protein